MGQQEVTGFSGRDGNDLWYARDLRARDARFVAQSVPSSLEVGQGQDVTVSVVNVGTTTWVPGQHRLGSQNPQDNLNWGLSRVELTAAVPPGQAVTFAFRVTARQAPGVVAFQWRMLQEGVEWFGDYTPTVPISVHRPGGPTLVPDVRELPRVLAANEIRRADLIAAFTGGGTWVVSQSPSPGASVGRGTTVTCRLRSGPQP